MDSIIVEASEYSLKRLSTSWTQSIVLYISNEQFGDAGEQIKKSLEKSVGVTFTLCELLVKDWDRYLTPWEADANMKGRVFCGQAATLLTSLENTVLPALRECVPDAKIYIAGYSLAGLFALWSLYESDIFDGAVCCSGSLWYPGWVEYATQHSLKRDSSVYLSLGNKEKNARHPLMKNVEDNTKLQYEQLQKDPHIQNLQLDWNEGGHFNNTHQRTQTGIQWILT